MDLVIGVSTDKAAPPVRNTYGLSKALMDRLFCGMHGKTATRFACVRFGNVAWSTGSVLPVWKRMHEATGVIGTTGPEMTRFFFTVDEAVSLIATAIENSGELEGKVLARRMKSALIRDVLELWIRLKGGSWTQIERRPGDQKDEFLIGDIELPYTYERTFGGATHYIVAFNQPVARPLTTALTTANAERLGERELIEIISNPPIEGA
jgi:FlaA1/EpsC-like NDP-sugar epimerase